MSRSIAVGVGGRFEGIPDGQVEERVTGQVTLAMLMQPWMDGRAVGTDEGILSDFLTSPFR